MTLAHRGMTSEAVDALETVTFTPANADAPGSSAVSTPSCSVCMVDYETGDKLTALGCKHMFHPKCIKQWLMVCFFEI